MSASDSCVCRRMFKSRIVERMVFSAEGLTAGLKPQNIELSRDFLIQRGRKQYPRKSNLTFGYVPFRLWLIALSQVCLNVVSGPC